MRLTFVGSGDAFAGGGRFQACLHLEGGPEPLLLDCGATALVALKRLAIDPASVGHIALSHLHGDHFAGLPWVILDGQFGGRTKPLLITGPEGVRERVERTFELLYPGATEAERPFEVSFVEFTARVPVEFGPARITAVPVEHSRGTQPHGLRVEYGGRVIAYSGDTEWTDALLELARGVDLLVCECNFFDTQAPGHLDYGTLMDKRAQLEAKRIVITHLSEELLGHLAEIELESATDGAVIEV